MSATIEERLRDVKRHLTLIQASAGLFSFRDGGLVADHDDVLDAVRMAAQEALDLITPIVHAPGAVACWTPEADE